MLPKELRDALEQKSIVSSILPVQVVNWEALDSFTRSMNALGQDIAKQLGSVDWNKIFGLSDEIRGLFGDPRIRDAFTALELIPAPTMDEHLIDRVVAEYENQTPHDEIHQIVLDHYDEDDCNRVAHLVEELLCAPDLVDREAVLRDVLSAYRLGLDAITAYPLVAVIEGVLITALVPYVTEPKKDLKHNKLADLLGDIPLVATAGIGFEAIVSMLAFMEGSLYHSSHWWDDEEKRKNYIKLNRHRLLHGMAYRGTRLNTLRCLLMLDLVAKLLPKMREYFSDVEGEDQT